VLRIVLRASHQWLERRTNAGHVRPRPGCAAYIPQFVRPDCTRPHRWRTSLELVWQSHCYTSVKPPERTPPERGEDLMGSALAKMTPAQRAIYDPNAPKKTRPGGSVVKLAVKVVPPSTRNIQGRHPVVSAARDQALVSRRNAQIEAIRKAYGGTLPTGTPPAR
jgi:hypothetical protein